MRMKRRAGKTATFSISVDLETRRILQAEAKRRYGGNVSALVAEIDGTAAPKRRRRQFDATLARFGVSSRVSR